MKNKHIGSTLDSFLEEQGIKNVVDQVVSKKLILEDLETALKDMSLSKSDLLNRQPLINDLITVLNKRTRRTISIPDRITELLKVMNSYRSLGSLLNIDHTYLSRLHKGEKTDPGDDVLIALGLTKTITYSKIR